MSFQPGDMVIIVSLPDTREPDLLLIGRIGTLICPCPIDHRGVMFGGKPAGPTWRMTNVPFEGLCCIREVALKKIDGGFTFEDAIVEKSQEIEELVRLIDELKEKA
jgi:hypothetical protein